MTRSKKIKLVAIVAALAIVLPLVLAASLNAVTDPMSVAAWSDLDVFHEEEIAPADPAITHDSFVIGEEVYKPTLTGSGNGVPTGWLAVPYGVVPWLNGGASGGWAEKAATDPKTNQAINTSKFTYTDSGLKAAIGGGDFALLMPTLKDDDSNEVDDYVYTVKATFANAGGQVGLITGTCGSETTFKGGTFHCYYGPTESATSWYYYHYGEVGGRVGTKVAKSDANAIAAPVANEQFTLTVYHYDGVNYFFLNDDFIHAYDDQDYYGGTETLSGVGLYFINTTVTFNEISVKKVTYNSTSAIKLNEPTIRYCSPLGAITGNDSEGLRFTATVDKTAATYTDYVSGTYATTNEDVKFGMLLIPKDLVPENGLITIDTPKVVDTVVEKIDSQDENSLTYAVSLLEIPDQQRDRVYVARAYMKVKNGDSWNYIYSKTKISRSYAGVANLYYTDASRASIRNRVDEIFEGSSDYKGSDTKTLTFSVFADLHYYPGGYITPVSHLDKIMAKANVNNVDFVMQAGDFCNNFPGSPEIVNAYLKNSYNLPAYGVLGNHDLENGGKLQSGETTTAVTSNLTNQNDNVVWGTADGKIGDGSIAYYYFDVNGFRIVCVDTNYFLNTDTGAYEHYPSWYSGPNTSVTPNTAKKNSLGDTQRAWLEKVLMDAADKDMPCIVVTHASTAGTRGSSQCGDYAEVQEIFRKANDKNLGTVLMVINGHHHTNHTEYVDGILYFDMNTSNGAYVPDGSTKTPNYAEDATFEYVEYDDDGNATGTSTKLITTLGSLGQNEMFYFEGPLSAIVHVSSNGRIVIEGDSTDWYLDVAPANPSDGEEPFVNSGVFNTGLY